jgi:hypothetical protein
MIFEHNVSLNHFAPLDFQFQELEPDGKVILLETGEITESSEMNAMQAKGSGRLLSYRRYNISETATCISRVSEETICLSLRWGEAGYTSLVGKKAASTRTLHSSFLIWLLDEQIELQLEPGEHICLDLFIRPEHLSHLRDTPIIGELLTQASSKSDGYLACHSIVVAGVMKESILAILAEIAHDKPILERFNKLCDSLLLLCLGKHVELEVSPRMKKRKQIVGGGDASNKLRSVEGIEGDDLLMKAKAIYTVVEKKKQKRDAELALHKILQDQSSGSWADARINLADIYIALAYFIASKYEACDFENKQMLKQAIVKACELSFELTPAQPLDVLFYTEWSGESLCVKELDQEEMMEQFSTLLSPKYRKLSKDNGSSESKLLAEQIMDALDLYTKSPSGFNSAEKPNLVVKLYKRLSNYFADNLAADEESLGKRGIVRQIDRAYEEKDLLTLLQIDMNQFANQPGYFDLMDNDMLKWSLILLIHEEEELDDFFAKLSEDPVYLELRVFHAAGDNLRKFKNEMNRQEQVLEKKKRTLIAEFKDLLDPSNEKIIVDLAKYLLAFKTL